MDARISACFPVGACGVRENHIIKSVLEPAMVARYGTEECVHHCATGLAAQHAMAQKSVCVTAPLGLPRKPWVARPSIVLLAPMRAMGHQSRMRTPSGYIQEAMWEGACVCH